jgi:hypothetical protein
MHEELTSGDMERFGRAAFDVTMVSSTVVGAAGAAKSLLAKGEAAEVGGMARPGSPGPRPIAISEDMTNRVEPFARRVGADTDRPDGDDQRLFRVGRVLDAASRPA